MIKPYFYKRDQKEEIMESSNMIDLHHLPDDHLLLLPPSALGDHFWSHDCPLFSTNGSEYSTPSISEAQVSDPFSSTDMVEDLGQIHVGNVKEEISKSCHQSPSTFRHGVEDQQRVLIHRMTKSYNQYYSSIGEDQCLGLDIPMNFGTVFPSINISSSNLPSMAPWLKTSLGMGTHHDQAQDLLGSALFSFGRMDIPSSHQYIHGCHPFLDSMVQAQGASISSLHEIPPSVNGGTGYQAKRASSGSMDQLNAAQMGAKKPRIEPRSSFSPFKVRKEKLGDRIAALQQLVAPFGKTDTASVLMEAIGYIKFLQDQVETLSVPYEIFQQHDFATSRRDIKRS
ncbi:Transcription factor bHLH110 [Apostasia shenzhenica]|uniref:Transcription factor bHLH110 n=1 Tax=Apostasia shenzhenica TaxID=1088818 RepID=A0A2I0A1B7_9ASPA|nr:Transcription factor bHLH110 [Apostasia shenzhenica]